MAGIAQERLNSLIFIMVPLRKEKRHLSSWFLKVGQLEKVGKLKSVQNLFYIYTHSYIHTYIYTHIHTHLDIHKHIFIHRTQTRFMIQITSLNFFFINIRQIFQKISGLVFVNLDIPALKYGRTMEVLAMHEFEKNSNDEAKPITSRTSLGRQQQHTREAP